MIGRFLMWLDYRLRGKPNGAYTPTTQRVEMLIQRKEREADSLQRRKAVLAQEQGARMAAIRAQIDARTLRGKE